MSRLFEVFICSFFILVLSSCNSGKPIIEDSDLHNGIFTEIDEYNMDFVDSEEIITTEETSMCNEHDEFAVYVCGAVKNPGVYYCKQGTIKDSVLKQAGGFVEDAACDYVNLAEEVISGERIYFPYETEIESQNYRDYDNAIADNALENSDKKININRASVDELMNLPGIGRSKAQDIVDYRTTNGSFKDISDIKNISGIKDGVYSKIKDLIVTD